MKENKPEEIINTLLKVNFDNIKDESLDIDLSACATIPSKSSNCSLLPSDFWIHGSDTCFLDESFHNEVKKTKRKTPQPKEATIVTEIKKELNNENKITFKYKCESCCVLFHDIKELSKHEASHKITFKCDECDRTFLNESGLKKHIRSHKNGSRNAVMECPDCGKFLKVSSMWMHRKIHSDSKRFSCDICGQKFVQKINLTHHTKVHTGEKPYECTQCQKTFPERSHLIRHQRYHSPTRPYKCEKCGKMYKTERCLKVHNLVHLEQRPYVCEVCDKSFISSSKLRQHSNIHTGERPYKCNYCVRDFTNFPNWLKHTRRRHKVDHKTGEMLQTVPCYNSKKRQSKKQNKQAIITKDEPVESEPNVPINPNEFLSLSLTSAEDLIMEQALEMEESGLLNSDDMKPMIKLEDVELKNEILCSNDSSPFSSPSSDFQSYVPLPPIATMTKSKFITSSQKLPSVETLFASSYHKMQSDLSKWINSNL